MGILVTGAKGFVGKNLVVQLKNKGYKVFEFDRDTEIELLDDFIKETEFIFHLAGVNRPLEEKEFMEGNYAFTKTLLDLLEKNNNKSPIVLTSSIQAELNNPYGESKRAGEELMMDYGMKNNVQVFVYRLPNLFGKWCRPNYNSAVATFCYNIARDLPITISNEANIVRLVYIDDLVNEFVSLPDKIERSQEKYNSIKPEYNVTLGELVSLIISFKESRKDLTLPKQDEFEKKLYSTYLSYLKEDDFSYPLKMNQDDRGSFTEFLHTPDRGQVSINISKPGITKGNHWHHTKNEKFMVVSGTGIIKFRRIDSEDIIEYKVSGKTLEVLDIPPGYTHNIINIGDVDMVTIMWANELFDPDKPDTYYLEV